jgi:HSP20 family protein
MMNRFEPERELLSLREAMNRLFEDSFVAPTVMGEQRGATARALAVDLYETESELVLKAATPGVKPEDIDITIQGDTLAIKGEMHEDREQTAGPKGARYHYRERRFGSFGRTLTLPVAIQPDKVEATFEHGVLTLRMPKAESVRPRQIKVRATGTGSSSTQSR